MGLGFDNGVILAISRDSNSRSEIYTGNVRMTAVELFLILLTCIAISK